MFILAGCLAASALVAGARTLTLDEAFDLAAKTNPDLVAAAERVEQSQDDVRSAYAFFLPQVTASGAYLWYNQKLFIQLPVPPPIGPVPPILIQDSPVHQGQITGTWPLLNAQGFPVLAAAKHGEKATEAAVAAGRQELLLGVAQAYWANIVTARLETAAEQAVANAKELSRVSQELVKAQMTTNLALYRAKSAEEQAQQFAISTRGARTQARAALRRLTGIEGEFEVVVPPPSANAGMTEEAALWEKAKSARPDLISAREALSARSALSSGSWMSYLPLVAGQGEWHYTSNEGLAKVHDGGTLGLVASWTLFDGNIREQKNAKLRSQARQASAEYESAVRRAREEVSRAAGDLETAVASRDAAREGAEYARQAQALAQTQYRAGTATNLEVTQANAALLQSEASLAQADAQAAIAVLALKKAVGEPLR